MSEADRIKYPMPVWILVLLVSLLVSQNAFPCAMPKSGPNYDSLIKVSGPHEDGHFKIALPRKLPGYDHEAEVRVEYGRQQSASKDPSLFAPEPSYSDDEETMVLSIPADELDDRPARVRVFWPPNAAGLCGAVASRSIGAPELEVAPRVP